MDKPILVTRSSMPPFEEYCREISSIWENRWLTNFGEKYQQFREELQKRWNVRNIELTPNGHMALELGLRALNLHGEVITTPYTFASTTNAILQNGLTPVFCDIKADDFTIDEARIEELITPHTSAIVAVHVYGQPCHVEKLQAIANKHHLKLVYDAAHAFDVTVHQKSIMEYGDLSILSFHATKVFHTIEGGAVACRDEEVWNTLCSLRNFGLNGEDVCIAGGNAKMNEFSAAMGICNLRHHAENIECRRRVYEAYGQLLRDIPGIRPFTYCEGDFTRNYAYYPIIVDEEVVPGGRDRIMERLKEEDIFSRKYFYPLTSNFSCCKGLYPAGPLPVAEYVSDHVLCLPMYSELTAEQVQRICEVIRKAANHK